MSTEDKSKSKSIHIRMQKQVFEEINSYAKMHHMNFSKAFHQLWQKRTVSKQPQAHVAGLDSINCQPMETIVTKEECENCQRLKAVPSCPKVTKP